MKGCGKGRSSLAGVESALPFGRWERRRDNGSAIAHRPVLPLETVRFFDRAVRADYTWTPFQVSTNAKAACEEAKRELISILWNRRSKMTYSAAEAHKIRSETLSLGTDELGKPYLMLNGENGPAVSFSHCAGSLWACLSEAEAGVGIDGARAEEFRTGYPYAKVFSPDELEYALAAIGGNVPEASALLWSAKEAAVKALGCGFHFYSPRDVQLIPLFSDSTGLRYAMRLAKNAGSCWGQYGSADLEIAVSGRRGLWLSVAIAMKVVRD